MDANIVDYTQGITKIKLQLIVKLIKHYFSFSKISFTITDITKMQPTVTLQHFFIYKLNFISQSDINITCIHRIKLKFISNSVVISLDLILLKINTYISFLT